MLRRDSRLRYVKQRGRQADLREQPIRVEVALAHRLKGSSHEADGYRPGLPPLDIPRCRWVRLLSDRNPHKLPGLVYAMRTAQGELS
jgi:hypothetical protein